MQHYNASTQQDYHICNHARCGVACVQPSRVSISAYVKNTGLFMTTSSTSPSPAVNKYARQAHLLNRKRSSRRPPILSFRQLHVPTMEALNKQRPAFLVSAAVNVGAMLFGFDTGVAGGVVALGSFKAEFGLTASKSDSANASSNVVALLNLGAFLGALAPPLVSRFVGRRTLIACAGLLFLLGGILQVAASGPGLGMIYGGRVVAGLGTGIISNVAPVFVAECAPKHLRGVMVSSISAGAPLPDFTHGGRRELSHDRQHVRCLCSRCSSSVGGCSRIGRHMAARCIFPLRRPSGGLRCRSRSCWQSSSPPLHCWFLSLLDGLRDRIAMMKPRRTFVISEQLGMTRRKSLAKVGNSTPKHPSARAPSRRP